MPSLQDIEAITERMFRLARPKAIELADRTSEILNNKDTRLLPAEDVLVASLVMGLFALNVIKDSLTAEQNIAMGGLIYAALELARNGE